MAQQNNKQPIEKIADVANQAAQSVQAESEPPHVRRYRAVVFQGLLISFAIAFAGLTFLVKTIPSFPIDLQITRAIQAINIPSFAWLMGVISWIGFNPQSFIITGLIVVLIYAFGLHWEAVMAFIAAVFTTAVNLLVKDLIQRPRPAGPSVTVVGILNSYSFPSGHVMFYIGFFGFLGFLAFSLLKPSLTRWLLMLLFASLIATIGISRIYLGEHWASDVLGSYLLGSLTLVAIIQFYSWGKTRFFVRQPAAAPGSQPA